MMIVIHTNRIDDVSTEMQTKYIQSTCCFATVKSSIHFCCKYKNPTLKYLFILDCVKESPWYPKNENGTDKKLNEIMK